MAESELDKAFSTLSEALTLTETEINEEIDAIQQQIEQLRERIGLLNDKQEVLTHDRGSIQEMYQRYVNVE